MSTIRDMAKIVLKNAKHFGSPDWNIYQNNCGRLDCRANSEDNRGWQLVISLYGFDGWAEDGIDQDDPKTIRDMAYSIKGTT